MEEVFNDIVSGEDLQKYERIYYDQAQTGGITKEAQFEYAWCLVRSKYPADIRKGVLLMEDLYKQYRADRRNYSYFIAIGYGRIKEYAKALQYCRAFLNIEPDNKQVQNLEAVITQKLDREGKIGMALAGAGVLIVGGIVGLGVALAKSRP